MQNIQCVTKTPVENENKKGHKSYWSFLDQFRSSEGVQTWKGNEKLVIFCANLFITGVIVAYF